MLLGGVLQKSLAKSFAKFSNVTGLQAVRLATLLKRDPCTGVLETAIRKWSTKEVSLKYSQSSQENTCVRVSFLITLRSSRSQIFFKMFALKNFSNFMGKHLCGSLFSIKLQARPGTLLKRDSNTCVFLWYLRNCEEHLFNRTPTVAVSDSFRFLTSNFIKKETPAKLIFCEFCEIFKNIFLTEHLRMYAWGWMSLFQSTFFLEYLRQTACFMYKLQDFNRNTFVTRITRKRWCSHNFKASFGRCDRDAFWGNEGKIHEWGCVWKSFFVNLQVCISQLRHELKAVRQLVWRKLLWWNYDLDWKTCLISMFS